MRQAMPLYQGNKQRETVTEFHGYDCTERSYDGGGRSTFSDMKNGGSGKFPFAASRLPRSVTQYDEATCALHGGEVLARVQPPYLIYGDRHYDLALTAGEKQIVRFSTKLLVFPDGKYFDTVSGECGDMDEGEEYNVSGNAITELIDEIVLTDGRSIKRNTPLSGYDKFEVSIENYQGTGKTLIINSYAVLDTRMFLYEKLKEISPFYSDSTYFAYEGGRLFYLSRCKHYYSSTGEDKATECDWQEIGISEIKIEAPTHDRMYDLKNIWSENQYVCTTGDGIRLMSGQTLSSLGIEVMNISSGVKLNFNFKTRTLPIFDYVTVCDNRLFGCRYGMPYDGSEPVNRIYVSALNNFKAFEQFNAISTDSWWGDVSEEGHFTGACTFNGYPMFFKEDYVYILHGDYPPYSYEPLKVRGVANKAAKSIVELDGALYYKSRNDIMRYTSSSLSSISQSLGILSEDAVAKAGKYRSNYYISLDGDIYVFDTVRGMWSKEDSTAVKDFASSAGELYFLSEGGVVYKVNGEDEKIDWSLTSPPIGYKYPNRKKLSSLRFRIEVGDDDELPKIELSFDGGEFEEKRVKVNFLNNEGKRSGSILVPILQKRCETFRYRISGKGKYKLTGVTKILKECEN